MKDYWIIPCIWQEAGTFTVNKSEYPTIEAAIEKLHESGDIPEGEYIGDSFEIDMEGVKIHNPELENDFYQNCVTIATAHGFNTFIHKAAEYVGTLPEDGRADMMFNIAELLMGAGILYGKYLNDIRDTGIDGGLADLAEERFDNYLDASAAAALATAINLEEIEVEIQA